MNIKKIKQSYGRKDEGLYGKENIKDLLGILYHENSKLDEYTARLQGESMGYFSDPYIIDRSTKPFKRYFGKERLSFDELGLDDVQHPLFHLILQRRSVRSYDQQYKVSLNELANILYQSYGITYKEMLNDNGGFMGYRNVPSAGGLYPLEIYVCLFNSHLEPGLYHYDDLQNGLVLLKSGDYLDQMKKWVKAEPYVDMNSSAGIFFITGMIERQAIKYGERSYRFMLQECGSVAYLMSLVMEMMGLGSCWTGAYLDQQINNFLGVDGNYEMLLNPIVFGKKKEQL